MVRIMLPTSWKRFVHPQRAYRLEYPAHWDQAQQDDGKSCGFGPHDREDVGLWISIMPMSLDTEKVTEAMPELMKQTLADQAAGEIRRDETLKHYGLKADILREGQGGHYWFLAGGDLVLFASSQVPIGERGEWNPAFERIMASLQITRDDELLWCQLANEILGKLRELYPDQEFKLDEKGIRSQRQVVYLSNLLRDVKAHPQRRQKIVEHFVKSLGQQTNLNMGEESWEEAQPIVIPVLKPSDYFRSGGPAQHQLTLDWLADVKICYALRIKNLFRFVTGWDVRRWDIDEETLHQVAMKNLSGLPWPTRLEGSRGHDGGRVILVQTTDSLSSSRLLHPELHQLFRGPLGSPFWAGIPDRDTLVLFSNRRTLKEKMGRKLAKNCRAAAYPITAQPFLVTADGIAAGA